MQRFALFALACFLGGLGGLLGSIVGNAGGKTGLFVGGVIGGLVGAFVAAWIARGRAWITPAQFRPTAMGAMLGFLAAAAVAVNTLSSPVGPVLSVLLVGLGALAGTATRNRQSTRGRET